MGIPLGTEAFQTEFAIRVAQGAIAQLPALHCITDWVVHTQLVKFCMASQLQFLTLGVLPALSGEAAASPAGCRRICNLRVGDPASSSGRGVGDHSPGQHQVYFLLLSLSAVPLLGHLHCSPPPLLPFLSDRHPLQSSTSGGIPSGPGLLGGAQCCCRSTSPCPPSQGCSSPPFPPVTCRSLLCLHNDGLLGSGWHHGSLT